MDFMQVASNPNTNLLWQLELGNSAAEIKKIALAEAIKATQAAKKETRKRYNEIRVSKTATAEQQKKIAELQGSLEAFESCYCRPGYGTA